jgi:hypothetical protein
MASSNKMGGVRMEAAKLEFKRKDAAGCDGIER